MKRKGNRKLNRLEVITPEGTKETSLDLTNLLIKIDNKYRGLLKAVANENMLINAFQRIIKKNGYYFKFNEDENFLKFNRKFFIELSKEIGSGSYRPQLTKKINYTDRNFFKNLITVDDIVQEAMNFVLSYIYNLNFLENSYNVFTVMNQYKKQFGSVSWIIKIEIKNCFNKKNYIKLSEILCEKISDRGFIDLYWKMVKVGYVFKSIDYKNENDMVKSSINNSILFNIYLSKLDEYMEKIKSNFFDEGFKHFYYIRYANDFIVGLDCNKLTATNVLKSIITYISNILKIDLIDSYINNFKHQRTNFLGYILKGSYSKKKFKKHSYSVILLPKQKILNKLIEKGFIKKNLKPTSLKRLIHYSIKRIIEYYNSIYINISTYYRICTFCNSLKNIYYILKTSCALTIALKMKLKTIKKVYKIYSKNLIIYENNLKLSFIKWDWWKK